MCIFLWARYPCTHKKTLFHQLRIDRDRGGRGAGLVRPSPGPFAQHGSKLRAPLAEVVGIIVRPPRVYGQETKGEELGKGIRKVDVRLPGKGDSNPHGVRPVHLIITMIKWIRTSRLSIKNSLSLGRAGAVLGRPVPGAGG